MSLLHCIPKTIFRHIITRILTLRFSLKIIGHNNLPRSGAVVIVANHSSIADAFIVDRVARRRSRYLVDAALSRHWYSPILAWAYDVIPVFRGSEFVAVRKCVASLRKGVSLVIFPEGRMSETGQIGTWRNGAGIIAKSASVPIVPIALVGAHDAWPPSTYIPKAKEISVFVASPIVPCDNSSGNDMLTKAMQAIRDFLDC